MKTRYNENVSIAEQAAYIDKLIAGEHKNWIPEKWVENFEFLWSHSYDENWWYFLHNDFDYIYLDRKDWWKVTLQRCCKDIKEKNIYWNVYLDKSIESPEKSLIPAYQELSHKFRCVRSLKHALYLWEVASENELGIFNPSDFFLNKEEWDRYLAA